MAIGISLIILSTNLVFDAAIDDGDKSQFLQTMSDGLFNTGILIFSVGLGILCVGLLIITDRIKKMKCSN